LLPSVLFRPWEHASCHFYYRRDGSCSGQSRNCMRVFWFHLKYSRIATLCDKDSAQNCFLASCLDRECCKCGVKLQVFWLRDELVIFRIVMNNNAVIRQHIFSETRQLFILPLCSKLVFCKFFNDNKHDQFFTKKFKALFGTI
jgi:hypothetical protein